MAESGSMKSVATNDSIKLSANNDDGLASNTGDSMKPVSFYYNMEESDQAMSSGETLDATTEAVPNIPHVTEHVTDAKLSSDSALEDNKESMDAKPDTDHLGDGEHDELARSREEKIKLAKEQFERERQRKINELLDAQRHAEELRLNQQRERRRKIDELRRRDEERRKVVEERRKRMEEQDLERRQNLLRRNRERESRIDSLRNRPMRAIPGMTTSAFAALPAPFGSSTPREISGSTSSLARLMRPTKSAELKRTPAHHRSTIELTRRPLTNNGERKSEAALTPTKPMSAPTMRKAISTSQIGASTKGVNKSRERGKTVSGGSQDSSSSKASGPSGDTGKRQTRPRPHSARPMAGRPAGPPVSMTTSMITTTGGRTSPHLTAGRRRAGQSVDRVQEAKKKEKKEHEDGKEINATDDVANRSRSQGGEKRAPSANKKPAASNQTEKALIDRLSRPKAPANKPPPEVKVTGVDGPIKTSKGESKSKGKKSEERLRKDSGGSSASGKSSKSADLPPKEVVTVAGDETTETPAGDTPAPTVQAKDTPAPPVQAKDTPAPPPVQAKTSEEEEYRARLAEQRRLAREKIEKEKEAERVRLEEQKRLEEDARERAAEERRIMEETTRKALEEEEKRLKAEEEKMKEEEEVRRREEEETRRIEEEERNRQREEAERQSREEGARQERERVEKARKEEEERLARKKRLEMIMSRVKKGGGEGGTGAGDGEGSPGNASPTPPQQQTEGVEDKEWNGENEDDIMTTSTTLDHRRCSEQVLPSPATMTNRRASEIPTDNGSQQDLTGEEGQPRFKSALLQSMLAGGRLASAPKAASLLRRSSGASGSTPTLEGVECSMDRIPSGMTTSASAQGLSSHALSQLPRSHMEQQRSGSDNRLNGHANVTNGKVGFTPASNASNSYKENGDRSRIAESNSVMVTDDSGNQAFEEVIVLTSAESPQLPAGSVQLTVSEDTSTQSIFTHVSLPEQADCPNNGWTVEQDSQKAVLSDT